ncbi:winged helix-turn-helix transcriptional regulator [Eubacterium sp. F2]
MLSKQLRELERDEVISRKVYPVVSNNNSGES